MQERRHSVRANSLGTLVVCLGGFRARLPTHPCIGGRRVGCATEILYGSDITPLSLAAHRDVSGNDLDNSSPSSHNQNVTKHCNGSASYCRTRLVYLRPIRDSVRGLWHDSMNSCMESRVQ